MNHLPRRSVVKLLAGSSLAAGLWPLTDRATAETGGAAHLETLLAMKADGKLRYVGLTTSHGRRHRELEALMTHHPIDFVQLTYNIRDREAEARLLPLAREKSIAVIANRPFQVGPLVKDLNFASACSLIFKACNAAW